MLKQPHPIRSQKGITLIELLATIVIASLVAALTYNILFQGFSNYQRITAETALRDEADLIMASLIKDLFVLNESEIEIKNECSSNLASSYMLVNKKNSALAPYKTGFQNGKIYIKDQQFNFSNKQIELSSNPCGPRPTNSITETANNNEYNINFTLKTIKGKKEYTKSFENTVQVIPEIKEGT